MQKLVWINVFSFLIIFSLVGCSNNSQNALNIPQNVRVSDLVVKWDTVDEATEYIVEINGVEEWVNETRFSLHDYVENEYTIRVKAIDDERESEFSSALTYDLYIDSPFPKDFEFIDNVLSWEDLEALKYEVEINGEIQVVDTPSIELEADTIYEIRVKAIYDHTTSVFSDVLTVYNHQQIADVFKTRVSIYSDEDLHIYLPQTLEALIMEYDEFVMDEKKYHLEDNNLTIDSSFIQTLDKGTHTIELNALQGRWLIEVDIIDTTQPYLITNREVLYQEGKNIITYFETFDYTISNLSGSSNDNLSETDYVIEDNRLVIQKDFINRLIEENPDRETVIVIAILQGDGSVLSEPISIKLP